MVKRLITLVVGARPNFMKLAPIVRELDKLTDIFSYRLINTGQHKDKEMNEVFFSELNIPTPDVCLKGLRKLCNESFIWNVENIQAFRYN